MNYLPLFMDLRGRPVLLVGGGEMAAAKARMLVKAGADLVVVAPRLERELDELVQAGGARHIARPFRQADVADSALVYSATGDAAIDEHVAATARAAGVAVNVVDRQDLCDFITPAIVDRDPVVVGISTGGAAPVLARRLRASIEALLPARLGKLALFANDFRAAVKSKLESGAGRRRFWERFFDGPIADAFLGGDERTARRAALEAVNRPAEAPEVGTVHIVGAGPGDPDLLTMRAFRLLSHADLVIHDRLIGPDILDYVRRDAERLYVGKSRGNHSRTQDEINDLMVAYARQGRRVVRLKGGDPFVFGRGGEELDHVVAAGIPVEVVPGITAATGCAAAAGIPLTHRDHAGAVTFISGHGKDGGPDADWAALAKGGQTIVVYMGLSTAGEIAGQLIAHGMNPSTPAAIIANGTLPDQKVVRGTLAGLETLVADNGIESPALIVIGSVAALAAGSAEAPRLRAAS